MTDKTHVHHAGPTGVTGATGPTGPSKPSAPPKKPAKKKGEFNTKKAFRLTVEVLDQWGAAIAAAAGGNIGAQSALEVGHKKLVALANAIGTELDDEDDGGDDGGDDGDGDQPLS